MKKNILKNAGIFAVTVLFSAAVLTSCNNASEKSSTADTSKMTTGDTSTMKSAPMTPMSDTTHKDTTDHKGDQKAPPVNN